MEALRIVLTVLMIIDCVALIAVILFQQGTQYGLGSLGGNTETYWSKNKGRSKEGIMVKVTVALVVVFFVLAALLNTSLF